MNFSTLVGVQTILCIFFYVYKSDFQIKQALSPKITFLLIRVWSIKSLRKTLVAQGKSLQIFSLVTKLKKLWNRVQNVSCWNLSSFLLSYQHNWGFRFFFRMEIVCLKSLSEVRLKCSSFFSLYGFQMMVENFKKNLLLPLRSSKNWMYPKFFVFSSEGR